MRISFGGGGTDLPGYFERYGGAVLSTSINKYFYTVLSPRSDDRIQVISADLHVCDTWHDITRLDARGSDLEIPLAVVKQLECKVPINLFLASEIAPGTGLGSSASVCVGILWTLATYLGLNCSRYELAEKAFYIANMVLGRPVGKQDEYAAAFGGLNYITFSRDGATAVEPLKLDPEVIRELQQNLLLFFTGASHNSWEILNEQDRATRSWYSTPLSALHEIHLLADEMRRALIRGDAKGFGRLLDESWEAKRHVSSKITNARIDRLYRLARDAGALGGKIAGAGGGGFLLLYCETDFQSHLREILSHEGLREVSFEFEFKGTHVLVNDPFLDGDARCGPQWIFQPIRDEVQGPQFRSLTL
jgi:D-glycero-alpha-D-manno-heptose-7-phosphate kinase